MGDLATPQDRITWVREYVLRMVGEELAEKIAHLPDPWRHDTNRQNINRYELGKRPIPLAYYRALSELSGFSLDWLIEGRGSKGTAMDAIRRMRVALDAIEEQYKVDPNVPPPDAFRRVDTD